MIHRISNCIGGRGTSTGLPNGQWVRAVPEPYEGGLFDRFAGAWAVLTGRAYAFRWPDPGELESALSTTASKGGE